MRTTVSLVTLLCLSVASMVVEAAYAIDPSTMQGGPAIKQPQLQQVPSPAITRVPNPAIKQGLSPAMKDAAFTALPDSAVVQFQGKPTTKGALQALEAQARRAVETKMKAFAAQAKAKFDARRAQFLMQQQAALQAIHAKAGVEATRLRQSTLTASAPQQEAIRGEAITLMRRSKVATPAEHAQIDRRALQLQQLSLPLLTQKTTIPHGDGNLGTLCKIVECEAKITEVVPFVSMIVPGGPVVIEGQGFGTQPGEIRLIGTVPQGTLGSFQGGYLRLEAVQFGGTWVYGKIPNVTAVLDQPAKLVVVTREGAGSNAVEVQFRAKREVLALPGTDVKVVRCGFDSNEDNCNGVMDPSDNRDLMPYVGSAALSAAHENCWGCVGDDLDIDSYEIRLKNQWTLQSADMWTSESVRKGEAEIISGIWDFPEGASYWSPAIQWRVTPNDLIMYSVHVDIVGPKDIPYK